MIVNVRQHTGVSVSAFYSTLKNLRVRWICWSCCTHKFPFWLYSMVYHSTYSCTSNHLSLDILRDRMLLRCLIQSHAICHSYPIFVVDFKLKHLILQLGLNSIQILQYWVLINCMRKQETLFNLHHFVFRQKMMKMSRWTRMMNLKCKSFYMRWAAVISK